MNKIIKVSDKEVLITRKDDSIITVSRSDIDFEPNVGDFVEVYTLWWVG